MDETSIFELSLVLETSQEEEEDLAICHCH